MPIPQYSEIAEKHRDIVFRNLVGSGLPERKEIIRAISPMGFSDPKSRSEELRRLSDSVLSRLDPEQARAIKELDIEWAQLRRNQEECISPERKEE